MHAARKNNENGKGNQKHDDNLDPAWDRVEPVVDVISGGPIFIHHLTSRCIFISKSDGAQIVQNLTDFVKGTFSFPLRSLLHKSLCIS